MDTQIHRDFHIAKRFTFLLGHVKQHSVKYIYIISNLGINLALEVSDPLSFLCNSLLLKHFALIMSIVKSLFEIKVGGKKSLGVM